MAQEKLLLYRRGELPLLFKSLHKDSKVLFRLKNCLQTKQIFTIRRRRIMRLKFWIGSQAFVRISKGFPAGLAMAASMTLSSGAIAGTITFSPALTDDASTGISTAKTYTHTVSGGAAAWVNEVYFDVLNAGYTPANFDWGTKVYSKNHIAGNNGAWLPASGGVTGPDLINLLGSFTYSSDGQEYPAFQTFTLSGLTPGETYDARIYIRAWDTDSTTGRPISIEYINGPAGAAATDTLGLYEDRPSFMDYDSDHMAYYVNYQYTAQTSDLVIEARVYESSSGSFHMYALSNEVVPAVPLPSSLLLGASGLVGILLIRRQRRSG